MKIGIVINTSDAKSVWNAFRFANTYLSQNHEVKIFLLGPAVEIGQIKGERFNVAKQSERFLQLGGKS